MTPEDGITARASSLRLANTIGMIEGMGQEMPQPHEVHTR